ncbi:MAG: hypothetical protein NTW40_01275 [Acidobacteria bacterium]|nr:hypothetical protein [Acidobacteriota bacterium]
MNDREDLLQVLRNRRGELDLAIQVLERVTAWAISPGHASPYQAPLIIAEKAHVTEPAATIGTTITCCGPTVQGDLKGLPGWEACRLVLRRHGEEMTVTELMAELESQGFEIGCQAKRSYVSTTLRRREDIFRHVGERLSARWGLHEWTLGMKTRQHN